MRAGLGFTAARRQTSRLAGLAGLKPCTHFCAVEPRKGIEGHAAWPGFYRRSATGLAARGSGADSRQLHSKDRHSATGLMARGKGRRGFDFPLAFGLAKKHKLRQSIPPRKD